jgi:hypothetical protein
VAPVAVSTRYAGCSGRTDFAGRDAAETVVEVGVTGTAGGPIDPLKPVSRRAKFLTTRVMRARRAGMRRMRVGLETQSEHYEFRSGMRRPATRMGAGTLNGWRLLPLQRFKPSTRLFLSVQTLFRLGSSYPFVSAVSAVAKAILSDYVAGTCNADLTQAVNAQNDRLS